MSVSAHARGTAAALVAGASFALCVVAVAVAPGATNRFASRSSASP